MNATPTTDALHIELLVEQPANRVKRAFLNGAIRSAAREWLASNARETAEVDGVTCSRFRLRLPWNREVSIGIPGAGTVSVLASPARLEVSLSEGLAAVLAELGDAGGARRVYPLSERVEVRLQVPVAGVVVLRA